MLTELNCFDAIWKLTPPKWKMVLNNLKYVFVHLYFESSYSYWKHDLAAKSQASKGYSKSLGIKITSNAWCIVSIATCICCKSIRFISFISVHLPFCIIVKHWLTLSDIVYHISNQYFVFGPWRHMYATYTLYSAYLWWW